MRILSLREAFKETLGFPKALTQLLDDVHYNQEGEGSCNVHLNEKNTEQVSKLEFMCNVMEKLAELEEQAVLSSPPSLRLSISPFFLAPDDKPHF